MPIKERRKFMRFATAMAAEYWAKGPSMAAGQGQVRDFSRQGVGMSLSHAVKRGEHVELTLKVPGDNIPIFATAEVTWSNPAPHEERPGTGLKFLSIKPLDLARLLDFVYSHWLGGKGKSS